MRGLAFLALAAALASPAWAQQRDAVQPDIVVTGPRIQDYRDRLAACLARHCPVNEDVDATLALAEAHFLNGDYADARTIVRASIARNRRQAAAFPEPVSDLFRASTRLSRHIGLDREARTSSFEILNALQAGLPTEDHRHFTARFEIAEMQMMSGNFPGAQRELERLAHSARAQGREDVATIAELRDRWYALIANPQSEALGDLITWSRGTEPRERVRATGARIILARHYRSQGDIARSDRLFAEIGRANGGTGRRLLNAPSYELSQQAIRQGEDNGPLIASYGSTMSRTLADRMDDAWIDVGFWITPDGRVSGVEILRQGAETSWSRPVLNAIGRRLYTAGPEATYRMERYTMTSGFDSRTGTRLQRRGANARIEYFDLTADTPATPPPSASN
jgi:hypothetical protein